MKDQVINPSKGDSAQFITMQAILPLNHQSLCPDYARLGFLLESQDPKLLVDLMVEDERFHAAARAVNERSKLHVEIVQPLLVDAGVREGGQYSLEAVQAVLGPQYGPHLRRSTEDAILHVESTCDSLLKFADRFAKAMKQKYPGRRFIRFVATTDPNIPLQQTDNSRSG